MDDDALHVAIGDDHVATIELRRPPNNALDLALLTQLADAVLLLSADPRCRAVVLASQGKHFCSGVELGAMAARAPLALGEVNPIYVQAARVWEGAKPIVAAVQGAAVGGGLGLAMVCDFRVGGRGTRLAANFAAMGHHPGFGLTLTMPAAIGQQRAAELLLTGRRIDGAAAAEVGLLDRLVPDDQIRSTAHALAAELAAAAPLAVQAIRSSLRRDQSERFVEATRHETAEQERMRATADFAEGVAAMRERRPPTFEGR